MFLRKIATAVAITTLSTSAWAACSFDNDIELKSLSNSFDAMKAVTDAMAECGNVTSTLDVDFKDKMPDAFAASPSLYQIGGVSQGTMVPLLNAGTIRPLDDLVAKYGSHLKPSQLIKVNGKIMAIAMQVNNQHLMYRKDIFDDLAIAVPTTYADMVTAAKKISKFTNLSVAATPIGGTYKAGWNLGEEFINTYLGNGGEFFGEGNTPSINNAAGLATLNTMKSLTPYMDPEYLVSDSTYVQQQFQQGKIAMANLWATRAAAMDNAEESQVVGKVVMASAPMGSVRAASTNWWDGIVFATNMTDAQADAAFRVAMEGIDTEMVQANNDAAVWLIDGFVAGPAAAGAIATADNGAAPYPSSSPGMGAMHTALGNGLAAFLNGEKDGATALADIEAAYTITATESGLM
ncbi:extracellular solute-binding protein [bacterium]|jgi:multiple sugar transport system substrate-binding protein|nr:extracellular solute-binding protein [bacterium]